MHPTSLTGPPSDLQIVHAEGTAVGLRLSGDAHFKAKRLAEAISDYSQAIDWQLDDPPSDVATADLLVRRAATHIRLCAFHMSDQDESKD